MPCTFTLTFTTPAEELEVIRRLKHWAGVSAKFETKGDHKDYRPLLTDCPVDADVERIPSDREQTPEAFRKREPPPKKAKVVKAVKDRGRG